MSELLIDIEERVLEMGKALFVASVISDEEASDKELLIAAVISASNKHKLSEEDLALTHLLHNRARERFGEAIVSILDEAEAIARSADAINQESSEVLDPLRKQLMEEMEALKAEHVRRFRAEAEPFIRRVEALEPRETAMKQAVEQLLIDLEASSSSS